MLVTLLDFIAITLGVIAVTVLGTFLSGFIIGLMFL